MERQRYRRSNRLGNLVRGTAVVVTPPPRERSAASNAGTMSFPQPYVEALWARLARVDADSKGSSKSL